ncbi:hypothetical protein EW146_g766 [Bondarzewia mesenterica]|uniref:Mediator of RNA polymerase II transcription subunit 5 n=1 Tax=Bondarzewia mesenterica TaxID=1095465 RepID=A0A4S4M868_9AGAM|nr:hypothetical protein EW146_g766 [Bondarzewia mesenterica]
MFSQFRNVVEGLAQQPLHRRSSQDASHPDSLSRSASLDSHLADSTISNFRKSLASQRPGSPGPGNGHASVHSVDGRSSKRRLEDRLRASFAIGEASNANSPSVSSHTSPSPVPAIDHPLSPPSIPLPNSPDTPNAKSNDPPSPILLSPTPPPLSIEPINLDIALPAIQAALLTSKNSAARVESLPVERHSEADIPLPQSPVDAVPPTIPEESDDSRLDNIESSSTKGLVAALEEKSEEVVEPAMTAEASEQGKLTDEEKGLTTEQAVNDEVENSGAAEPDEEIEMKAAHNSGSSDIETLRERLKLVEQRFSDVSTSFKRIQAEKLAADRVLQDLTPVQTMQDADGLRDYLQNFTLKVEMSQDEIKRLNGKLTRQEERIEELRDTHRLESKSQIDLVDNLRKQLNEAEALIKANEGASAQQEAEAAKQKADIEKLHTEVDRYKSSAKDEEEKRTKAVSLLKSVRQKLVKAEKDRDEAVKELNGAKEREKGEREKEQTERVRLQEEIDKVKADKEATLTSLRVQFERETVAFKEKIEKDMSALKGQFELEAITNKSSHDRIVDAKNGRIVALENSVQSLSAEKDSLFDQLQLRQGELESSQSHLEVLQSQTTELQYQLRECNDRISLLTEELAEVRRDQELKARGSSSSAEEVARLLSSAEAKYEAKIFDFRRKLSAVEAERSEIEAEWSRKLEEKAKEADRLRGAIDFSARNQQVKEDVVGELKAEIEKLKEEVRVSRVQTAQIQAEAEQATHAEDLAKQVQAELHAKMTALEQQIEEAKARESQARAHNKTLRDELRKVQSSAALLERQRNPGVGYWSSPRPDSAAETQRPSSPTSSDVPSRVNSPQLGKPVPATNDEEVNLEYLRNVILQFLEHKEMRPNLVHSVLILFSLYPGDFSLQTYLTDAIEDGLLSLGIFVATFLQAARSPELHNPATLDMLCRIAIESHFTSGLLLSSSSLISFSESPDAILASIRDALELLRVAHSLPFSHFHRLLESVGYLVTLLLGSFTEISNVSRAQAMACMEEIRDVLQMFQLSQEVREALEVFVQNLGGSSFIRDVQAIRPVQSLGKGDILSPGSESDTISCSLMLYHLVSSRAKDFGSGNEGNATALIVATYRATSWTLTKFCTQLILASINCLVHDIQTAPDRKTGSLWRAFVLGRLPRLLLLFEKNIEADGSTGPDSSTAVRDAWGFICLSHHKHPLLVQYDNAYVMSNSPETMDDMSDSTLSFARDFTQQLMIMGLVDQIFAARVDATLGNDGTPRLQSEAREAGVDLESYLNYKMSPENGMDDASAFLERVYQDFSCHANFAESFDHAIQRFTVLATSWDVDSLGHLAKILHTNEAALDIVSLHIKISDLIVRAVALLDQYDCETVGDPGTAVSHLGDVVIFLQWTMARYKLSTTLRELGDKPLDPGYLRETDNVQRIEDFSGEQAAAFNSWFKALFDKNSEGIEDGVLRSTRPKILLTMAATLCSHAITACTEHKIDADVLNNGFSYFTGPLLNWTLVGIVKALIREVKQTRFQSPHHLTVLRSLLLSPTCPRPVLCLCGHSVLRLLSDPQLQRFIPASSNMSDVQTAVTQALGLRDEANNDDPLSMTTRIAWHNQPRHAIQTALTNIRLGKPPSLDVSHCLLITPPTRFLHLLWFELSMASSVGINMDALRRLAVFVLATPRMPGTPPLLPIFLHNVLPSLMDMVDRQPGGTQSMHAELLAAMVSLGIITALHLERAMLTVTNEQHFALGESSSAMARRLAGDLRQKKWSPTAKLIAQRLASSGTFVSSFPVFKTEI